MESIWWSQTLYLTFDTQKLSAFSELQSPTFAAFSSIRSESFCHHWSLRKLHRGWCNAALLLAIESWMQGSPWNRALRITRITMRATGWKHVETRLQLTCNALQCSDPCSAGNGFFHRSMNEKVAHSSVLPRSTHTNIALFSASINAGFLAGSDLVVVFASTACKYSAWDNKMNFSCSSLSNDCFFPVSFLSESCGEVLQVMINRNEKQTPPMGLYLDGLLGKHCCNSWILAALLSILSERGTISVP